MITFGKAAPSAGLALLQNIHVIVAIVCLLFNPSGELELFSYASSLEVLRAKDCFGN